MSRHFSELTLLSLDLRGSSAPTPTVRTEPCSVGFALLSPSQRPSPHPSPAAEDRFAGLLPVSPLTWPPRLGSPAEQPSILHPEPDWLPILNLWVGYRAVDPVCSVVLSP